MTEEDFLFWTGLIASAGILGITFGKGGVPWWGLFLAGLCWGMIYGTLFS